MNKKGICFYFGYPSKPEKRAEMIKKYGFDCIITNADKSFDFQNGSIKKQVKLCKKYGLELSSLHMQYHGRDLREFWKNGKLGDKLEKTLIKDVKIAKKYGFFCVVVHLYGTKTEIGIERIKRVLKYCEKYNIPLALENIGQFELLKYTFDSIQSKYLKFCFDIGHQNYFDKEYDILENFGDKLICLHLHSNDGTNDEHTLKKYGNIDWETFARRIAKLNSNINLDYEILMHTRHCETDKDVLKEVIKEATELEQMIEKFK